MTTPAQTIRDLVDDGIPVYWSHEGYQVIKDSIGQYLIGYAIGRPGENYIGLTWRDNETLNGKHEEFFAVVPADRLTTYTDHRGCFHRDCPYCGCMVIFMDDDHEFGHHCTIWRNP